VSGELTFEDFKVPIEDERKEEEARKKEKVKGREKVRGRKYRVAQTHRMPYLADYFPQKSH